MPSIYEVKPRFQQLLMPVVDRMAAVGVRANQVTAAAVLVSAAGGAAILLLPEKEWPLLLLPLVLLVRMALNAIDGLLARRHQQQSQLGAVLNETGDVVSDVLLYLPLTLVPQLANWAVVTFVVTALLVEFVGVVAVQIGSPRRYDGPLGKSDRAFWVSVLAVLVASNVLPVAAVTGFLICLILMSVLTAFNRTSRALSLVKGHSVPPSKLPTNSFESDPCQAR